MFLPKIHVFMSTDDRYGHPASRETFAGARRPLDPPLLSAAGRFGGAKQPTTWRTAPPHSTVKASGTLPTHFTVDGGATARTLVGSKMGREEWFVVRW